MSLVDAFFLLAETPVAAAVKAVAFIIRGIDRDWCAAGVAGELG